MTEEPGRPTGSLHGMPARRRDTAFAASASEVPPARSQPAGYTEGDHDTTRTLEEDSVLQKGRSGGQPHVWVGDGGAQRERSGAQIVCPALVDRERNRPQVARLRSRKIEVELEILRHVRGTSDPFAFGMPERVAVKSCSGTGSEGSPADSCEPGRSEDLAQMLGRR